MRGLVQIFIILQLFQSLPNKLFGQVVAWEDTITGLQSDAGLLAANLTSNQEIIAVGSRVVGGQLEFLTFDTLGNLLERKSFLDGLYSTGFVYDLSSIPGEPNFFYASGYGWDTTGTRVDFVCKIDSVGVPYWNHAKSYAGFYATTRGAVIFPDKSIVVTGFASRPSFGFDIVTQRIDSNGVQLWERFYNLMNTQEGMDMAEMMDGSIMVYGDNEGQNTLLRIGFDGEPIDFKTFSSAGNPRISHAAVACTNENKLLISNDSWNSSNYDSEIILVDEEFQIENVEVGTDFSRVIIRINNDSTFYLDYTGFPDSTFFNRYFLPYSFLNGVSFPLDGFRRGSLSITSLGSNSSILTGYKLNSVSSDYWIAKIDGLVDEWIPDHCSFSPPQAGFKWSYDGGVLACFDTSFAGLKYHDSVYHYTWSGSNGFGSDSSSFYSVWDTSLQSSIDITLIIENFYRCKDTVTVTLSKSVLGIGTQVHDELKLSLYPNPFDDILGLEFSSRHDQKVNGKVSLFDPNGSLVLEGEIAQAKSKIDLEHLHAGIYFLRCVVNGKVLNKKLVKR